MRNWRLLLYEAVNNRAADMNRIGGIEQYLQSQLSEEQYSATAVLSLTDALEAHFRTATLSTINTTVTLNLLDIAAAFRPAQALPLILGFLREHVHHDLTKQIGVHPIDLRRRALEVLEAYFPAPPLTDSTQAYDAYGELLRQYVTIADYAGHCAARLLELGMARSGDPALREALQNAGPSAFEEFRHRITTLNTAARAHEHLEAFATDAGNVVDAIAITRTEASMSLHLQKALELNNLDFGARIAALPGVEEWH